MMTESEWLTSEDPDPLLGFLCGKASDRKFRLFQVACCRRIWEHLPDDGCREAVLVAERLADGQASDRARRAMRNQIASYEANATLIEIIARSAVLAAHLKTVGRPTNLWRLGVAAVVGHAASPGPQRGTKAYKVAYRAQEKAEANLVRCIFGNPFRTPMPLDSALLAWNDGTIVKLAQAIYEERTFDRLPILADALEEGGCVDVQILGHCREPGQHARGCWVVDAILHRS